MIAQSILDKLQLFTRSSLTDLPSGMLYVSGHSVKAAIT